MIFPMSLAPLPPGQTPKLPFPMTGNRIVGRRIHQLTFPAISAAPASNKPMLSGFLPVFPD
jgi:hypothetical protein